MTEFAELLHAYPASASASWRVADGANPVCDEIP